MKRSWFLSWGRAAGLGLVVTACVGKEVSVGGEAGDGLDRCVGSSDGCLASVRAQPVEPMSAGSCEGGEAVQLEVDYSFNVRDRLCPALEPAGGCGTGPDGTIVLCPVDITHTCNLRLLAGRPAPDGSLWLVISKEGITEQRTSKGSLWLGHVGDDGSDLGFQELAKGSGLRGSFLRYDADLAVDAESRAHVIINGNDPGPDADSEVRDHTWLAHYEPDGRASEGVWDLPGIARSFVALAADGRFAVAGDAVNLERRALAALLEADGSLIWSQPKLPSTGARSFGVLGLGVDNEQNVFVYTHRSERDNGEFGVLMFDRRGQRVWDRTLDGILTGAAAHGQHQFVVDADGNAAVVGGAPIAREQLPPTGAKLLSLDVNGDTRWTLEIRDALATVSVDQTTGALYMNGVAGPVRISKEGQCSRLLWPRESRDARGTIEPGSNGDLYFVSAGKAGRYKPVAQR